MQPRQPSPFSFLDSLMEDFYRSRLNSDLALQRLYQTKEYRDWATSCREVEAARQQLRHPLSSARNAAQPPVASVAQPPAASVAQPPAATATPVAQPPAQAQPAWNAAQPSPAQPSPAQEEVPAAATSSPAATELAPAAGAVPPPAPLSVTQLARSVQLPSFPVWQPPAASPVTAAFNAGRSTAGAVDMHHSASASRRASSRPSVRLAPSPAQSSRSAVNCICRRP